MAKQGDRQIRQQTDIDFTRIKKWESKVLFPIHLASTHIQVAQQQLEG